MTSSFQQHHGAMLLKYSGISFISGAVNHGFFSGTRSLWTAAMGIVLFVLGAWLEHRLNPPSKDTPSSGLLQTLVLGTWLSIGLGFFTGGLQHFPDSPARSAWVVPLGFFISVLALGLSAPRHWPRAATVYVLVVGLAVTAGSWGAWQWFERHPDWAATGHSHGENSSADDHHGPASHAGPIAQVVSRSITVNMDDQMRFTPSQIDVQAGETIRFVVRNTGQTTHEMVLGSEEDIRVHAAAMKQASAAGPAPHEGQSHAPGHDHGTGIAISVAAGQIGELVVTFPKAMTLQMACLIPGHYEAGMRGTITVGAEGKAPAAPEAAKHDHRTHPH
ncbi:plastocyanin/azurin family copper-binding protein [Limnohabitans sp. 2KL-27]|uniref:cupredoxin domain-containing protein n=1 Tax=Limnohabitans sp. 2KL-27 TaxID=1100705 RepID=UPI000B7EF3E6|nr:plastocyanin/azurin family copper-binding protein [Limnohabitans sp. 2KL-27]